MLGYSFLYTNRETLSLGVGVKLSHLQKTGLKPYDLLEYVKRHPLVRRKIEGAKTLEYSAHLIPEGGWHSLPPLYTDGFLIAGDAAQMINAAHREGSNLAMAAGRMAGETVVLAKKDGDFSKKSLSRYQKKLEESFILPDLYLHRDLETIAEKHLEMLDEGSVLAAQSAFDFLTVDGRPKELVHKQILERILRSPAVRRAVRSELSVKNAFRSVPLAWKGLKTFLKLFV
jgi:electron transfer flavoprotein-quinone oxidoreductase